MGAPERRRRGGPPRGGPPRPFLAALASASLAFGPLALALLAVACGDATSPADGSQAGGAAAGPVCAAPAGTPDLTGFRVSAVPSSYPTAPAVAGGFVTAAQSADLMLSGFGFDRTGGALMLNHPRSLASDGTRLLLSDGNNNRVLVWRTAPSAPVPPDFVLGQRDFDRNAPGTSLAEMSWPGQVVVTPDGKLVVADTYNDRVLVWRSFPTASGQPADFAITHASLRWPWGVWSDGNRLVASSTGAARLVFWNTFPGPGDAPSFQISGSGIGTPRTITSDGRALIVGDHNANLTQVGNWWWTTFPTGSASAPSFFAGDPTDPNAAWMQGTFLSDGRLLMLGARSLNVWNAMPTSAAIRPDLIVTGHGYRGGDGGAVAFAQDRIYALEYNGNRAVAYAGVPSTADSRPAFALGSPDLVTNTLTANYVVTNAVPSVSRGRLAVSSDFDRRLLVWNSLPDASGAFPNWAYDLPFGPWDAEATDTLFALAGQRTVAVWKSIPAGGALPAVVLRDRMGTVDVQALQGVAVDDRYFYLADNGAGKVYVWRGIPTPGCAPAATLVVDRPTRLSSDGTWLAVTQMDLHTVRLFRVSELRDGATGTAVGGAGTFNLPQHGLVARGALFVANTTSNVVHAWRDAASAAAGRSADVVLGSPDGQLVQPPRIGRSTFFWPGAIAFDGAYLWVGEFKFSNRILRFTAR